MKKQKLITLTENEDLFYSKRLGTYLSLGEKTLKAEKQTIEEMKEVFPRLQAVLIGDYKIAI